MPVDDFLTNRYPKTLAYHWYPFIPAGMYRFRIYFY